MAYDIKVDYSYAFDANPVDTGSCDPISKASTAIEGLVVTITFADGYMDSFILPITDYSGDISEKANDVDVLHKTGSNLEVILGDDTAKPLSDFATSSQGAKADSAIQQSDLVAYLDTLNLPDDTDVLAIAIDLQAHIEDFTNPHNVTKTQVGLGDVDNTSDINKPVSNLQQLAIAQAKNAAINTANLGLAKKVDKVAGSRLINTAEVDKLALLDEKHYKSPVQSLVALKAIPEAELDDKERRYVEAEGKDYFYNLEAIEGDVAPDDQTNTQGFWNTSTGNNALIPEGSLETGLIKLDNIAGSIYGDDVEITGDITIDDTTTILGGIALVYHRDSVIPNILTEFDIVVIPFNGEYIINESNLITFNKIGANKLGVIYLQLTETVPDITAPSVPTGLVASNITDTSATITWNASID